MFSFQNHNMRSQIPTIEDIQQSRNENRVLQRHFGSIAAWEFDQNGDPKYSLGPDYCPFLCCLLISSLLSIYMAIDIVLTTTTNKIIIAFVLLVCISFFIYSYIKVSLSNPGYASSSYLPQQEELKSLRFCLPCRIVRPARTVHCLRCDICIIDYDHHCPWIGKCVGRDNLLYFKMFLLSVSALLIAFGGCIFAATAKHKK